MNIKAITIIIIVAIAAAFAVSRFIEPAEANKAYVVKEKWHKPPKQVKKVVKFKPWAEPTVSQVHKIMNWEQKRWGGPSLINRIYCESKFKWYLTYGQYMGLLQYGPPAWAAAWPSTPRKVTVTTRKTVKKPFVRYRKWSHMNKVVRRVMGYRTQIVWTIRKGTLPKNATPFHGWAAIRAGQRAVSGHGPNTMWACGL